MEIKCIAKSQTKHTLSNHTRFELARTTFVVPSTLQVDQPMLMLARPISPISAINDDASLDDLAPIVDKVFSMGFDEFF